MATKNKKTKLSASFAKRTTGIIVVLAVLCAGYKPMISFLKKSDYFAIKDIWYESSLQSIQSSELTGLKGRNLFSVDIQKIQKQLQSRYPQFKQLMVLKRFPNQILVVAKKRTPVAQVKIQNRSVTVDERGAILVFTEGPDSHLPLITGVRFKGGKIQVGSLTDSRELQLALKIIRAFETDRVLSFYRIARIDVGNLSEIYFYITNNLKIIMDEDNLDHEFKMLGLVLPQAKIDTDHVKYVDLRFKEPILGKK